MSGTIRAKYFRCVISFNLHHILTVHAPNPNNNISALYITGVISYMVLWFCTFYKTGREGAIIFIGKCQNCNGLLVRRQTANWDLLLQFFLQFHTTIICWKWVKSTGLFSQTDGLELSPNVEEAGMG